LHISEHLNAKVIAGSAIEWQRLLSAPRSKSDFSPKLVPIQSLRLSGIARLNILIYYEHVIDLYQLFCAPYLMARRCRNKG
jgi:hypothetical protein